MGSTIHLSNLKINPAAEEKKKKNTQSSSPAAQLNAPIRPSPSLRPPSRRILQLALGALARRPQNQRPCHPRSKPCACASPQQRRPASCDAVLELHFRWRNRRNSSPEDALSLAPSPAPTTAWPAAPALRDHLSPASPQRLEAPPPHQRQRHRRSYVCVFSPTLAPQPAARPLHRPSTGIHSSSFVFAAVASSFYSPWPRAWWAALSAQSF